MKSSYVYRTVTAMLLAVFFVLDGMIGVLARNYVAAQGNGGLAVAITQVDSQDFPQVTAYVTVLDDDGWPISLLTAADFQVSEDGEPVPAESIVVERDETRAIGLVLALDTSTPGDTFDQIREAARSFAGLLKPQDQVAVITFGEEVHVVQDFTDDKEELRAAIAALQIEGDYTALNEAAIEAAAMTGALPPGRQAVIMLTDSEDNVGEFSTADAIDQALEAGVPLYVLGLEPKVDPQVLSDMTKMTGGLPLILSYPSDVKDSLHAIERLLRQGYRVTFRSELESDDASHDLTIGVTYAGKQGEAQGTLMAVPGEVTVTLPDIADGQTVGGVVNLNAEVTAPAPVASVAYLLDDQLLTKLYAPTAADGVSYSFDWDSTAVEPGGYTLTVKVVDSAGNEGQAQVQLHVALPLTVTLSVSPQEIKPGDGITLEAQVDALAEVTGVEFSMDGRSLGSVAAPPYRLSFDSSSYPAGEHIVTARAMDGLGREGSANLAVQFRAPPEPAPRREWLRTVKIVAAVVAAVIGIIVAVIAFVATSEWRRKRHRTVCRLEIQNLGNVRSRYLLLAEDPSGDLVLQFTLNGINLHQPQVVQAAAGVVGGAGRGTGESVGTRGADQLTPSGTPVGLEKVRQATGQATGASQAIIRTLDNLGYLLPGPAGGALQRWASRMRQQQAVVSRIESAPRRAASDLRWVRGQVSRVKPSASPARAMTSLPPTPSELQAILAVQPDVDAWGQTPFVEPGEILAVDLLIDPIKRLRQAQHYPIMVISRSVEQADAAPVIEEGSIQVMGISWFDHLLPVFVFVVVIMIQVWLIGLLLRSTSILG